VTGDPIDITHGKALLNLCVSVSDSGLLTDWLTHTATLGFMKRDGDFTRSFDHSIIIFSESLFWVGLRPDMPPPS